MICLVLIKPTGAICWRCKCDKCDAEVNTDEEAFEHARHVMLNSVWMEMPRRGAGMMKWHWLCETCKPKGSSAISGSMRSTPIDTTGVGRVNDPPDSDD